VNDLPTFSIVIETATQATSDLDHLDQALDSLRGQTATVESANEIIVVDTGGAPLGDIERVCSKYARVQVRRFEHLTDYFDTKNAALPFVTGEVVLFADSDCEYEPAWLFHLLEPFNDPQVHIVTGETWHHITNFYDLAVGVAWVLWPFSDEDRLTPVGNYWANTVAFRRAVIQQVPFRNSGRTQRGGQAQHVYDLLHLGHTIWKQPKARAYHPIPGPRFVFRKMFLTGRDAAIITSKGINPLGTRGLWGKRVGKFFDKLGRVLKLDWRYAFSLPLALPITALLALLYSLGYVGIRLDGALRGRALKETPL
jgi:glycosyltransferase involved in cell wall biosynthesis